MPGFTIAAFACGLMTDLLKKVILNATQAATLGYFERARLERKINEVIEAVVDPALALLEQEHVEEERQTRFWQTCHDELVPLLSEPASLFEGSLDGQKIYENSYSGGQLPEVIREDGLEDVYARIFPRVATLLCKMPAAIRGWEPEAWKENFRRQDALAADLRSVSEKVDTLQAARGDEAASLLARARRLLLQEVILQLDVTSLRSEQPLKGKLDHFFVCPAIATKHNNQRVIAENGSQYVDVFLKSGVRAIVVGAPGSGKSTWTRWLQRYALGDAWDGLPVRVELRSLKGAPLPPLGDLVRAVVSQHLTEEVTAERVRDWLDGGKLAFLIDGFDELGVDARDRMVGSDDASLSSMPEQVPDLMELAAAAPQCPIILTSRPLTSDHLTRLEKSWERWEVEPFDRDRVSLYVRQWYANMPLSVDAQSEVDPDQLAEEWLRDPAVGPLTGNPLLLATLVMVHHLDGKLPPGRAALYQRYVTGMLGVWDDRRGVSAGAVVVPSDVGRYVLSGIAINLHLQDTEEIEHDQAVALVRSALDSKGLQCDAGAALDTLVERSGLIVGAGVHTFVHKTVGEFLVAEAVLQGDRSDERGHRLDRWALFDYREEDHWNVVTFLWAGLVPLSDLEEFVDKCIDEGSSALGYGLLDDQWERFPVETRRRLLLRSLEPEVIPPIRRGNLSVPAVRITGYSSDNRIHIPTLMLRGITDPPRNLYMRAIYAAENGLFHWADLTVGSNTPGHDVLWIAIAVAVPDLHEWSACLKTEAPSGWDRSRWLWWVAQVTTIRCLLAGQPSDVALKRLTAVPDIWPEAPPPLPLLVMSALLELRGPDRLPAVWQESDVKESVARAIIALDKIGNMAVTPECLAMTRAWNIWDREFDLLTEFLDILFKVSNNEQSRIGPPYTKALELTESLIRERRIVTDRSTCMKT